MANEQIENKKTLIERIGDFLFAPSAKAISRDLSRQNVVPIMPDMQTLGSSAWGIGKSWTAYEAITEGYDASVWVYACVNKIAKAVGSIPWGVYERGSDGKLKELKNHPLAYLLAQPNGWQTQQTLIERWVTHRMLAGNGIIAKSRTPSGDVGALWAINPDVVSPVPGRAGSRNLIETYKVQPAYRNTADREEFPVSDIIHTQIIDPQNQLWGLSPLRAAARTIGIEGAQNEWNRNALNNRVATDSVLALKGIPTPEQQKSIQQYIQNSKAGSLNARGMMVLGTDATLLQHPIPAIDLDFVEGKKITREEICAIFEVPPLIVGIQDQSTYNNMATAQKIFWLETILPLADRLAEDLTLQLARRDYGNDNLVITYSTAGIQALSEIIKSSVDTALKLFSMGYPANVINDALYMGLPVVAGGDIGYIGAGLIPAGMVNADAPGNDEPVA